MSKQVGRFNVDIYNELVYDNKQKPSKPYTLVIISDFGFAENNGPELGHKQFYFDNSPTEVRQFLNKEDIIAKLYAKPEYAKVKFESNGLLTTAIRKKHLIKTSNDIIDKILESAKKNNLSINENETTYEINGTIALTFMGIEVINTDMESIDSNDFDISITIEKNQNGVKKGLLKLKNGKFNFNKQLVLVYILRLLNSKDIESINLK